MPKKGRARLDPIQQIAQSGVIGYVPDEEDVHQADEPGVIWVEIEHIKDNPYQHAEHIDQQDFQTLVESIKADGFLGALNVSPFPGADGEYYLNGGGHQRRNAAREAGMTKLPVFVSDEPEDRSVLAFRVARENTSRVNTSIINLGHLYQQMIEEFNLTQEHIAQRIGKDRNHVKFALMAVKSPADIQDMLRQRPDSLRAMTYFRRLDSAELRRPIMERFLTGDLSTEGVRLEVEAILHPPQEDNVSVLPVVVTEAPSVETEHVDMTVVPSIPVSSPPSVASAYEDEGVTTSASISVAVQETNQMSYTQLEEDEGKEKEVIPSAVHRPVQSFPTDNAGQLQTILKMLQVYQQRTTSQLEPEERLLVMQISHVAQDLLATE